MKMPVLFVGHGSPMNALMQNPFTGTLGALGKNLPRPKAILMISAHWETQGTQILNHANPPTIHDFYGFPKPLFEVEYPAKGAPELAAETLKLLPNASLSEKWGYDHGTWSVLVHMYPDADIPVYQLSIDMTKTPEEHLALGRMLQPLRDQGVMIVGSGNIVHNLRLIDWRNPQSAYDWAKEFDADIKNALEQRDSESLTHFESKFGAAAEKSVPTPEHYYPLLYCFGASDESDKLRFPYEGFEMGSLSMRNALWEYTTPEN